MNIETILVGCSNLYLYPDRFRYEIEFDQILSILLSSLTVVFVIIFIWFYFKEKKKKESGIGWDCV